MISLLASEAAPGFDDPLEMLHACHGRILGQCDTLRKLAIYLTDNGCDRQAQQAAQSILRFFDTAGQFHHQDEEENMFPVLLAAADSGRLPLKILLDKLLQDHVAMLAAWAALRPVLLELSQGKLTALTPALAENFISRYAQHIAVEESELLPYAAQLLDSRQVQALGKCMAERRGAKFTSGS